MDTDEKRAMKSCMSALCNELRFEVILPNLHAIGIINDENVNDIMVNF